MFNSDAISNDLADMQLINKYNKGIRCLLCAIDLFNKYVFAVPLKDKKETTIANAFQSILKNLKRMPNKICEQNKTVSSIRLILKNG